MEYGFWRTHSGIPTFVYIPIYTVGILFIITVMKLIISNSLSHRYSGWIERVEEKKS